MLEEWNLRKTNERLQPMIFIVVKFKVKPDWSERWPGLVNDFTQATRQEPGNLWFDWSRSVEDPNEFVLVEAFKDDAAGDHVNSEHFKKAMVDMPQALAETPRIVSRQTRFCPTLWMPSVMTMPIVKPNIATSPATPAEFHFFVPLQIAQRLVLSL